MRKYRFIVTTYEAVTITAPDLNSARRKLAEEVQEALEEEGNPDKTFNINEGIDLEKWQERNKQHGPQN